MARGENRRDSMRKLSEFAGEDVLVDLASDLEKDNEGLRRALARADARKAEIVSERDEAIRRAAAAEARCGQIPTWRRLAEDLAAATTEADCWGLQARARVLLLAAPNDAPPRSGGIESIPSWTCGDPGCRGGCGCTQTGICACPRRSPGTGSDDEGAEEER